MNNPLHIGRHTIGRPLDPYVIAEIGVNHGGSLDLARQLIDQAAAGGAHAAKFQCYKASRIASRHSPAYWDTSQEPTSSQYELFSKYDGLDPDDYAALAAHCNQRGIDFLSTPFDLDAVTWLTPLVPAFKLASADITHVPLLRAVARSGKPLILSTGAASPAEIEFALETVRAAGAEQVILLHCVLNYPTAPEHAQIGYLGSLKRLFPDCPIGYSDHVPPQAQAGPCGLPALELATVLGACVLEKHFTHDKSLPGNDHYHAMDRADLAALVERLGQLRTLYGGQTKDLSLEAQARRHARRSIVAARTIEPGEVLSEANLDVKRPAHGISPLHWDLILGRVAVHRIDQDRPLQWADLAAEAPSV